jgi:hypothetical protein
MIAEWLASLGLSEYAHRFAENGIDISVLRHLTDQDLKDVGVLSGIGGKCWPRLPSLPTLPLPRLHPRSCVRRCRLTPQPAHSDVLRSGRFDCSFGPARSRGPKGHHRGVSPLLH